MIILPPDPEIVTDDEEIDVACTSSEHGHVAFDEKIQEETDGTIEIIKEKDAAEYILTLHGLIVHQKFHQLHNYFTDMILGKSHRNFLR
ncbi:hypothetical protein AVEN_170036-1 [Araneus ventricosus]|uniref:Uncharacterized protein n=1 Tax=Araneus ventricosus TaxID=182803 RepID=A0A4Y2N7T3_ARAVE|nr:hypothetical protein AVEN_170036-1 [Araneus ventricosus]